MSQILNTALTSGSQLAAKQQQSQPQLQQQQQEPPQQQQQLEQQQLLQQQQQQLLQQQQLQQQRQMDQTLIQAASNATPVMKQGTKFILTPDYVQQSKFIIHCFTSVRNTSLRLD